MDSHRNVLQVARSRGLGVAIEKIAGHCGVYLIALSTWLERVVTDGGARRRVLRVVSGQLRKANKSIWLPEQQADVLKLAWVDVSHGGLREPMKTISNRVKAVLVVDALNHTGVRRGDVTECGVLSVWVANLEQKIDSRPEVSRVGWVNGAVRWGATLPWTSLLPCCTKTSVRGGRGPPGKGPITADAAKRHQAVSDPSN